MKYLTWLVMCLIFLAGCESSGSRTGVDGEALFAQAGTAYVEKHYGEAAELFARSRSSFGSTPRSVEAAGWEGLSLLELGRLRQARAALEKGLRSGEPGVRARSAKGLARLLFAEGRYREAAAAYEKLGADYPGETDAAELLAARVETLEKGGEQSGADSLRRELNRKFPNSPYAKAITENVGEEGGDWYVVQAGAFNSIARARELQSKLCKIKVESFIAIRARNGESLYTVRCGSFRLKDGAIQRVRELSARGVEAVVITENRNR